MHCLSSYQCCGLSDLKATKTLFFETSNNFKLSLSGTPPMFEIINFVSLPEFQKNTIILTICNEDYMNPLKLYVNDDMIGITIEAYSTPTFYLQNVEKIKSEDMGAILTTLKVCYRIHYEYPVSCGC